MCPETRNANTDLVSPVPPRSLSPSVVQRGINYFFHHFVTGEHCPERGYLNYIPAVLGADGTTQPSWQAWQPWVLLR